MSKAAASGDPDVQKLLADRQTLEMNRDAINPAPNPVAETAAIDADIAVIDAELGA